MRLLSRLNGARSPSIWATLLTLASVGLAACGGLEPIAPNVPVSDASQLFVSLALRYRAISLSTVAPYDTVQLIADPRNALGEPMAGLPAPTFRLQNASDSTALVVSPDGFVQAKTAVSSPRAIIAEIATEGNIRHADTTWISIISGTPPQLVSMSIDPVAPDSVNVSMPNDYTDLILFGEVSGVSMLVQLNLQLRWIATSRPIAKANFVNASGQTVTGEYLYYRSIDSLIAGVQVHVSKTTTRVYGVHPGDMRIEAKALLYGQPFVDTATFHLTWPVFQVQRVYPPTGLAGDTLPQMLPHDFVIAPSGVVMWQNMGDDSVDVVFDDPANVAQGPSILCDLILTNQNNAFGNPSECGTGSLVVPGLTPGGDQMMTTRIRQFPVPGIYTYHSTKTGTSGRIVVTSNPNASTTSDSP